MKKILFSCLLASVSSLSFSQTVFTENFESLTLGNLGTDITGATQGQGGWYTTAATTAANSAASNFQVVNNSVGTHGKVLSILGSAGAAGTKQINQNDKLASVWSTRATGNDILQYEFDVYSGSASTSQNTARVYLWDGTAANKVLIGFALNQTTKQFTMLAYSNPCDVNNDCSSSDGNWGYTFNTPLDANTWYKVGMGWNSVSGEFALKVINETTGANVSDQFFTGKAAGATPTLANIQVLAVPNSTVTSNTVAATILYDNIKLRATNTMDDLLAVDDVANSTSKVSVFPNPFHDVLKISDVKDVKSISVNDMSGRQVKTFDPSTELNLSSLQGGLYIVNLHMEDGSVKSVKAIKK